MGVQIGPSDGVPDPLNPDAFGRWLETKPREWSVVIAVRAALRALPLVARGDLHKEASKLLLGVFRAIAIARFVIAYPMRASEAASVVDSAADALPVSLAAASSAETDKVAADASKAIRHAEAHEILAPHHHP